MLQWIRSFLLFEAVVFFLASLTHFGVLIRGYEHRKAGTAEGVIGVVLLAGLLLTQFRSPSSRGIGLAVQGFALLGTFVGIFMITIGIGPRTGPDVALHTGLIILLVSGLIVTARTRPLLAGGQRNV